MHVSSRRFSPLPWRVPSYRTFLLSHMSRAVVGSQVKSLYRHGRMSECHDKMEDFKFCMSLKSMEPEAKRDVWIRRRAEWWANRRLGKSSENVWDVRKYASSYFPSTSLITSPNNQRIPVKLATHSFWRRCAILRYNCLNPDINGCPHVDGKTVVPSD